MTAESRYKRWKRKVIAKKRMCKRIKKKKNIQRGKTTSGGNRFPSSKPCKEVKNARLRLRHFTFFTKMSVDS